MRQYDSTLNNVFSVQLLWLAVNSSASFWITFVGYFPFSDRRLLL